MIWGENPLFSETSKRSLFKKGEMLDNIFWRYLTPYKYGRKQIEVTDRVISPRKKWSYNRYKNLFSL